MASMEKLIRIAGGLDVVKTVIDVGANDGADSLPYARLYPAIRFIAVEPTPELARRLESESETLDNYTVVPCAIGRADGEASFNIRRSSVHNSLEAIDESNVARAGIALETYELRDRVSVPVRTLESLCDELMVEEIDVLHVDAQGSDMDVLVSAGELLQTVRAGVVEVGRRLNLYSNSVGRRELIRFLSRNGLRVVTIDANDQWNYEQNVFFTRASKGHLDKARALAAMVRADVAYVLHYRVGYAVGRLRSRVALRTRLRKAMRSPTKPRLR
jgi:FkbM family methyltransferase